MTLKLSDFALCRTPAFCTTDTIEDQWENLKNYINYSSPVFYQLIANQTIKQIISDKSKTYFSVWKYFNRAKFRATPYGYFASISAISVCTDSERIQLSNDVKPIVFKDWTEKDDYCTQEILTISDQVQFVINSTVYEVGDEIRYVRFIDSLFRVETLATTPELRSIIQFCSEKRTGDSLFKWLKSNFQFSRRTSNRIIKHLIYLDILLTEKHPNIVGADYFERIETDQPLKGNPYIISIRQVLSGGLAPQKVKHLPELIEFLADNLPVTSNDNLDSFKRAFTKKFDQDVVPLALALDPETGIGYGRLEQSEQDGILSEIFKNEDTEQETVTKIIFSELHKFLLNGIVNHKTIDLHEFEHSNKKRVPLPNTFNVTLYFADGRPVIDHIGGCTATSLLGRYTIANSEIHQLTQKLVKVEEDANPDIIFFDIGYQAESRIDNVNRRAQIYNHELPILSWSCDDSPLSISDMLVSVHHSEVVLWSRKHNKRMIPRLASAYNYTRSDLALYRFLCDLQHQGIKSDLNFDLQRFFPDLDFYPKVIFKDIIVSPARWKIPDVLSNLAPATAIIKIKSWLYQSNINFPFKVGFSDQTLRIDPGDDSDVEMFISYCRQYRGQQMYIQEAFIFDNLVTSKSNKPFAAQFILNFTHPNKIYSGDVSFKIPNSKLSEKIIFPGGEWLYFEVYCHPVRSNELLNQKINKFITDIKKDIEYWFFVRYYDPAPHIRLRIKLRNASQSFKHVHLLKELLSPERTKGYVSDLQVKTYFPEIHRYGTKRISLIEKLYGFDSKHILIVLKSTHTTEQLYNYTLKYMEKILSVCFNELNEKIVFAENVVKNFIVEFELQPENFKKLNSYFKQFDSPSEQESKGFIQLSNQYLKTLTRILDQCDINERPRILADILHMHINRLFITDQRRHEALLYYFLVKVLKRKAALLKSLEVK